MKITQVETILLTGRWCDDPSFPQALHSTAFIRIRTDKGLEGIGETTFGYFAPETVPAIVEFFEPVLVGKNPEQLTRLTRDLYDESVFWARNGAGRAVISGLELALWDLAGKMHQVPVYKLLGGAVRERIPVYASGGPTSWPKEKNKQKIEHYRNLGYRAAKLSTGLYELVPLAANQAQTRLHRVAIPHSQYLDELEAIFQMLRQEFGPDFDFAIDGHEGAEPKPVRAIEAIAIAKRLERFRIRFYEEPLAYTNMEGYCELRRQSLIPIAGGESLSGVDQFHAYISRGALDLIQPDLGFVGGLSETIRIMHDAEAHNVGLAIHSGGAVGPVMAASWHLAAASLSLEWLETVVAPRSLMQDFLADPLDIKNGCTGLPESHGLGVRLTPQLIDKYRFIPKSGERT
jgi:L-alanine-DL-glutamate epimerase-like enolase superfamily enzyme